MDNKLNVVRECNCKITDKDEIIIGDGVFTEDAFRHMSSHASFSFYSIIVRLKRPETETETASNFLLYYSTTCISIWKSRLGNVFLKSQ